MCFRVLLFFNAVLFLSQIGFSQASNRPEDIYKLKPNYDKSSKSGVYMPKSLDESFIELNKMLHPLFIAKYKNDEIKPISLHHGLGMWMRNNWGLWAGGPLAEHFKEMGIFHPDDVSGIILESYQRHLQGKPLELEKQIEGYKEYWEAVRRPSGDEAKPPGCGSGVEIEGGFFDNKPGKKIKVTQWGRCKSDRKLWAFERSQGWFEPDAALMERIKESGATIVENKKPAPPKRKKKPRKKR